MTKGSFRKAFFFLHRWCPFTFLTRAGVLIGWLAAPFSSGRVNGGEECERRSESAPLLALKGPAAEKFWGLKILSLDFSQPLENNKNKKTVPAVQAE